MNKAKVGIVILAYNDFDYLSQCLRSIQASACETAYAVHVLDNGSNLEIAASIQETFDTWQSESPTNPGRFWRSPRNLGFAGGNNFVIKELLADESYTHFLLLNSDVLVTNGWLDHLIEKEKEVIGPVTNSSDNEQMIDFVNGAADYTQMLQPFAHKRYDQFCGYVEKTSFLTFFCCLFSRRIIHTVGILDEQFFPGGFEDDDYCKRVEQAGFSMYIARDTFVYHFGSASFLKIPNSERSSLSEKNKKLFEQKWNEVFKDRRSLALLSKCQDALFLFKKENIDDDVLSGLHKSLDALIQIASQQAELENYYYSRDQEIKDLYHAWEGFLSKKNEIIGEGPGAQFSSYEQLVQFINLKLNVSVSNLKDNFTNELDSRFEAVKQEFLMQKSTLVTEIKKVTVAMENKQKIEDLQRTVVQMQRYSDDLQQRFEDLQQHANEWQQHGNELQRYSDDLQQRFEDLQQHFDDLQQHSDDLQQRLEELQQYADQWQQHANELQLLLQKMTHVQNLWDVNKIKPDLENLVSSKAYRLSRNLRAAATEIRSGSPRRMRRYVASCFARLAGKRDSMNCYADNDLLISLLRRANMAQQRLSEFQQEAAQSSALPATSLAKEYPLSYKQKHPLTVQSTQPTGKRVAYFTNQLLDWFDGRPRYGGGERYAVCLANLLTHLGFEVQFFQAAATEFKGKYYGYQVQTIPVGDGYSEFNIGAAEKFYQISLGYDYVIYNLPEYASATMRSDALLLCHGIWFDHDNYNSNPYIHFRSDEWFQRLYDAFDHPRHIVSVDTNSINVIRSLWPELATKMTFIPNFADTDAFYPPESRNNEKLTIIFPRRAQINRGSRLLGDILKKVPSTDVVFYWIGEGDKYDNELIEKLTKQDSRLHFVAANFDEMPDWYRKADISVVPTIACEGTSLSCIESMACGCATIATNVGGLPDIIFDEINGLVVNPTADELAEAINRLIEDGVLRKRLQEAGYAQAQSLAISNWEKKWSKVLDKLGWIQKKKEHDICILTKNATHGGVESLIKLEQERLNADIIVTGGLNNATNTCPFMYEYVSNYVELVERLKQYRGILYHWLPNWAVQAIRDSGVPAIEFVHRTDTAECDKSVPARIASHSQYVCDYIKQTFGRDCCFVSNAVDTNKYIPATKKPQRHIIGAVTSYTQIKGIDVLINAWASLEQKLPAYELHLYGAGTELDNFKTLAQQKHTERLIFHGPVFCSKEAYDQMEIVVSAARHEGLPIALLEALACNVPILASDIEGHQVINRMAKAAGLPSPLVLFQSEDINDFGNKLLQMIEHPMENNGRIVAEEVFGPDKHVIGLQELLDVSINERKAPAHIQNASSLLIGTRIGNRSKDLEAPYLLPVDQIYELKIEITDEAANMFTVSLTYAAQKRCGISTSIDTGDFEGPMVNIFNEGILVDERGSVVTYGARIPAGTKKLVCRLWSDDDISLKRITWNAYAVK